MILICAHAPMSPRARTSVPDLWSENKMIKKEWIWVMTMLIGIAGWRATSVYGASVVLLANPDL